MNNNFDLVVFGRTDVVAALDKVCKIFSLPKYNDSSDTDLTETSDALGSIDELTDVGLYLYARYSKACTTVDFTRSACVDAFLSIYDSCWNGANPLGIGGSRVYNCLKIGMLPHRIDNPVCDNFLSDGVSVICLD